MPTELAALVLACGYCFAGFGVLAALRLVHASVRGVAAALGLAFMVGVAGVLLAGIALLCIGAPVGLGTLAVLAALIGTCGLVLARLRNRGDADGWRPYRSQGRSPNGLDGRGGVVRDGRGGVVRDGQGGGVREGDARARARACASPRLVAPVRQLPGTAARAVRRVGLDRWIAIAVVLALGVFAALTFRWARVQPLLVWDSWSIWARKATLLYDFGHLPSAFFTSPVYAFMHQGYPLLIPLYESSWFHAVGSADTQSLHVLFWVLFVAFLWATAYVASHVARPAVWAPLVGLLAVTPAIWNQLMTMYADVPMGLFLMLGVLALGTWISGRRRGDLALATLMLAAAASTKDEGLTGALGVLAAALLVTLVFGAPGLSDGAPGPSDGAPGLSDGAPALSANAPRLLRRRALAPLVASVAGFAVLIAPWRLWLAVHHITSEMPVGRGLDPSYLIERSDRVSPTVNALFAEVMNQSNWCYLLPIGLALVIAGLATRRLRTVSAFYGLATFAAAVMILWAYVISANELAFLITTSANRTVVGPMLIVAGGTFHLAGGLTRDVKRRMPDALPVRRRRVLSRPRAPARGAAR